MKKIWRILAVATCVLLPTTSLQAATPEEIARVVQTLTRPHSRDPNIKLREMYVSLKEGESRRMVTMVIYPNPVIKDGTKAFSVYVHEYDVCGLNMADDKLNGQVMEAMQACVDGSKNDGKEYFDRYGGPQALFDKIIAEALK